jgi:hypothetical protein
MMSRGAPVPTFFDEQGCGGKSFTSTSNIVDMSSGDRLHDDLTSALIPPNYTVIGYDEKNYGGFGDHLLPGYYSRVPHDDDYASLGITKNMEWSDFVEQCCVGKQSDKINADTCGPYWKNSATCKGAMQTYCSGSMGSDTICRDYCKENPGACDSYMLSFCSTTAGKADPICACYNSKLKAPSCFDKKCMNGGYRNSAMLAVASSCPSIIKCTQKVDIKALQSEFKDFEISQECGETGEKPGKDDPPIIVTTPPVTGIGMIILGLPLWVWIMILIVVVLIAILTAVLVFAR